MELLQYTFMQRAFLSGILLAVITPFIGITIVLKRMSMIGDALSHASLAGVAAGLILGINPVAGAGVVCVFAALGIEKIRKNYCTGVKTMILFYCINKLLCEKIN